MSQDLESQLRAALRPVAPSKEFSQKLLANAAAPRRSAAQIYRRSAWWLGAAVAASLLLAIGVQQRMQDVRERESGLEARRQVLQALRVTSQKLDLAYEAVKSESSSLAGEQSGV
jgi:hypothetical protein